MGLGTRGKTPKAGQFECPVLRIAGTNSFGTEGFFSLNTSWGSDLSQQAIVMKANCNAAF